MLNYYTFMSSYPVDLTCIQESILNSSFFRSVDTVLCDMIALLLWSDIFSSDDLRTMMASSFL